MTCNSPSISEHGKKTNVEKAKKEKNQRYGYNNLQRAIEAVAIYQVNVK